MNTKEQPLISVIAPVYNVKKYLPKFLDSMLAQTYQNFELLLVDDGSTDGGLEVLQYYAAQDARLHIFCKENGGVASARNFGLEQARGEYIGFVDPDDAMLPQYLARLYAALAEQDATPHGGVRISGSMGRADGAGAFHICIGAAGQHHYHSKLCLW